MLIRVEVESQPRYAAEPVLFREASPERRPRALSLLCSIAIHAVVLTLISTVSQYGIWYSSGPQDLSKYKLEMLPLRVPLYFAKSSPPAPRPQTSSAARSGGAAAALSGAQPAPAPSPDPPARVLKSFELPSPRATVNNAPVILQPEMAPPVAPPKPLPSMAFWARLQAAPKRPVREFVTPGRTEKPSPAPKLDAPPVLAVPNRQPKPSDINIALAASPASAPRLPVPNSSTVPVRLQQDGDPSQAASLDPLQGDAANVIVLAAPQAAANLMVEVPRGSQGARSGSGAGANSAGAGGRGGVGQQPGAGAGAGRGSGAGQSAGAVGPGAAAGAGAGGVQEGGGAGNGRSSEMARNGGIAASAPPSLATPAPLPPIRITHSQTGSFDVVIAQSSATREDLPDVAGILTGNPIYTVYLRVGDEREWLLEYCLPGEKQVQTNAYEVNIGPVAQVTPPYPLFTSIPGSVLQQRHREYIVMHGYLTANGNFKDVKTADSGNTLGREILAMLGDWQFRPALRDRVPIGVEILLVVPPR